MKKILLFILLIMPILAISQKFPQSYFPEGFELAVMEGRVIGYSTIDKFGLNPEVLVDSTADIWEGKRLYTYDEKGTAPIISISSR